MDSERIKNDTRIKAAAERVRDAIKEATGRMIDDTNLEAEGKLDEGGGATHESLADLKDASLDLKDRIDEICRRDDVSGDK